MLNKDQLIEDSHAYSGVWYAGYDASNKGKSASECPFGPERVRMMNVWLSGHVSATDERALNAKAEA